MPSKGFVITYAGDAARLEVTRVKFEERTQDLVVQTMDFVHQLLRTAGFSAGQVDVVLLVGGSTKMPMVKAAVEQVFPGKVRFEQPELAVAKGAALAAAIEFNERLSPVKKAEVAALKINVSKQVSVVNDKLSRSFGSAVYVDDNSYMIDNLLFVGDDVPSETTETYGPKEDNQKDVEFKVFENVARDRVNKHVTPSIDFKGNEQYTDPALKVKSLGSLRLELPPGTPKGSPIQVFFRVSTIGVEVRATNVKTSETVEAVLSYDNNMSKEELNEAIKQMASIRTSGNI